MSIELSLDEVLKMAGQMGFCLVQQETIQAPYLGEDEPPDDGLTGTPVYMQLDST